MRFDLTDLRLFLNVHEAGTITGGAQRSHLTLASASERIRGMEAALGVPLLARGRRGASATPAGLALAYHARTVLQQMEHMRADLDQYGRGLRGHVRLLSNTAALSEYLPATLAAFLKQHARISIDVEERSSQEVAHTLRQGHADLGIAADSTDLHGLQTHAFRDDPLSVVVARDHPLAGRGKVSLADIVTQDFIGLAEGSALQTHIGHHAQRLGQHLNYRVRLHHFDAICRMVADGVGIAIVPRTAALRSARSARIKRLTLQDAWADRTLMLCVRDAQALPAHVGLLMRHLLQAPPR